MEESGEKREAFGRINTPREAKRGCSTVEEREREDVHVL